MGHIELSRAADLVVVAPATADLIAKLAHGHANDLASTLLLATDKRVLLAPAMNVRMWLHPATRRNLATVARRRRARGRAGRGRDGLRRVRPRPDGRAAGDRRGDRRGARAGAARRAARARHLGADARADRPGALHRQPLVGPPGHARSPRRWPAAARASPSSPGRPRRRGRSAPAIVEVETAREMLARRRGGAAGRRRGLRRRRRRLARDRGERQQGEEGGGRAAAGARRSPRTPTSCAPSPAAARAGRGSWSASPPRPTTSSRTPSPSGCARAPTGSWRTTCARRPGSWAAPRTR